MHIRRGRPEEAETLTELTMRSKAHWGYDAGFLAAVRDELTFRPSRYLPDFHVYVLESDSRPMGFCSLIRMNQETVELEDLFVDPACIGQGHGKRLWDFAVTVAREAGFARLTLIADPFAERFYARQGAIRIGEKASSAEPGRKLPMMEYRLSL